MGNQFRKILKARRPSLSRLMRHINGRLYPALKRGATRRLGHRFQGCFKAALVDDDAYLLEVCRYLNLNPVRAGMVKRPGDCRWT